MRDLRSTNGFGVLGGLAMWRCRLLLLPFGAVVELAILLACWCLAVVSRGHAEKLMRWATRTLPSLNWYIGQ